MGLQATTNFPPFEEMTERQTSRRNFTEGNVATHAPFVSSNLFVFHHEVEFATSKMTLNLASFKVV
jgi:hypothetical protein